MAPQSQLPQFLRFDVFAVDVRAGELRRDGAKLKPQEQPFQVLCALLEHPGELVTREELRSRLWPADTFVDFDHGLNAAIRRLREALGDSAEIPSFVETVARRRCSNTGFVDASSTRQPGDPLSFFAMKPSGPETMCNVTVRPFAFPSLCDTVRPRFRIVQETRAGQLDPASKS